MASTSSSSSYTPPTYPQQTKDELLADISERILVMREQERIKYAVPDYLAPEWQARLREATSAALPPGEVSAATAAANAAAALANPHQDQEGGANANNATPPQADASSSSGSSQITEVWREKICEWCYQVVDHFDFNREVVSVAMSYLDRYLATRTVNRRIFQLAAMTALYLAIKLFEPGRLRMSALIDLSRGYFLAEHIVTMEDSMLQSLEWRVHPPTPFAFCRDLARLVSADLGPRVRHDVNELARFMTELSVCDYWFARRKPSSVALASLINAMELQGARRVSPHHKCEFLQRAVAIGMDISNDEEIIECYERLREMYNAGGYNPSLDDEEEEGLEVRVETGSPTGVADGPDAGEDVFDGESDDDLSVMECA